MAVDNDAKVPRCIHGCNGRRQNRNFDVRRSSSLADVKPAIDRLCRVQCSRLLLNRRCLRRLKYNPFYIALRCALQYSALRYGALLLHGNQMLRPFVDWSTDVHRTVVGVLVYTLRLFRSCHAHSSPPFRPLLPCSYLAKSRPQHGCLPVTSSPPDSGLTGKCTPDSALNV